MGILAPSGSSSSVCGADDAFVLDSFEVNAADPDTSGLAFRTLTAPFPFYLVRVRENSTSAQAIAISFYANLSAF